MPGLGSSGPQHWQTHWERANPNLVRVEQESWDKPVLEAWVQTLDRYVQACKAPPILVAHSLATVTVAHWALQHKREIRGAMLVAPADVDSPKVTEVVWNFRPLPMVRLPFPSVLVASINDPYADISRIEDIARAWGCELVNIGACGHINADSDIGDWSQGQAIFRDFFGEFVC